MENNTSPGPSSRPVINQVPAPLAETELLEKTYEKLDSIFPGMEIEDLDTLILVAREGLGQLQHTENRDSSEYGKFVLRLALLLVTRFIKKRQPDDFTEAKELEAIIHRRHFRDNDEHEGNVVDLFKSLIGLAAQVQEIQKKMTVSDTSAASRREAPIHQSMVPPRLGTPLDPNHENEVFDHFILPPLVRPPFIPPMTPTNMEMVIRHTTKELHTVDVSCELGIYASYCFVLAFTYFSRYQQTGDLANLDESLDYQTSTFYLLGNLSEALDSPNLLIPQTITIVFTYLSKLGFFDMRNAQHSLLPRVTALELLGDLIPFIPALSPHLHIWSSQLGNAYYRHYITSKDPDHAEAAIAHFLRALEHTRVEVITNDPSWFARESRIKLGILFCERYTRISDSNGHFT